MQKWQKQVAEIIRNKFPDDETSELAKEAAEVLGIASSVKPPTGDLGKVVAELMKLVSKTAPPLTSTYIGFRLGVAWKQFNAR